MELKQYLTETGESQASFARRIGRTEAVVCRYISGQNIPGAHAIVAIEDATDGRVTLRDWVSRAAASTV